VRDMRASGVEAVPYSAGMRIAITTLAIVLGLASLARAEEIKEIVVDENTKTSAETVALIARIEVGDDWNLDMIQIIEERLVSSGLFKDVRVFSEPHRSGTGVKVTMLVKDKHSWIIAPAFYTQPTNIGGGVGFGENNLFGKNQKLLLYGQIATQDSFFIGAWIIPNLGGTRWYAQMDTFLKSSRLIEYLPPQTYLQTDAGEGANKGVRRSRLNYLNAGAKLGIELFRGFRVDARLRAAHVSYGKVELEDGASIEEVTGDPAATEVPDPGIEGWDVTTEFSMSLDRRANWYGIQSGYRYAVSFESSARSLGSDFRYYLTGVSIYRAERILERHNFVFKSHLGYGFHLPFQQEFLSGGTSMRGWLNNQFRGDFRAVATGEYSVPLFTVSGLSIRGLAFWDSAYTTFLRTDNPQRNYLPGSQRDNPIDPLTGRERSKFQQYMSPLKNSVGIGTRFYLRQIVLPLLGLDFGYGLEARDFQVYLAIGLTD
jgi:outer membrane protein insertion porin family